MVNLFAKNKSGIQARNNRQIRLFKHKWKVSCKTFTIPFLSD